MLTIFSIVKLVEDAIFKRLEALSADEAVGMKEVAVGVDSPAIVLERFATVSTVPGRVSCWLGGSDGLGSWWCPLLLHIHVVWRGGRGGEQGRVTGSVPWRQLRWVRLEAEGRPAVDVLPSVFLLDCEVKL